MGYLTAWSAGHVQQHMRDRVHIWRDVGAGLDLENRQVGYWVRCSKASGASGGPQAHTGSLEEVTRWTFRFPLATDVQDGDLLIDARTNDAYLVDAVAGPNTHESEMTVLASRRRHGAP